MTVENATYINQLDETLPLGTNSVSEGDNHLRLIKETLKNTFPELDGAVNLTSEQFDKLVLEKKNYDNIENPSDEQLRVPVSIDEAVEWADKNLEARVSGSTFKDGKYNPEEPVPEPRPLDYPNEKNLYDLNKEIDLMLENYKIPVNGFHYSIFNIDDMEKHLGYGEWEKIDGGKFIVTAGTMIDLSRNKKTYNVGNSTLAGSVEGSYQTILTVDQIPEHDHSFTRVRIDRTFIPKAWLGKNNESIYEVEKEALNTSTTKYGSSNPMAFTNLMPSHGLYIYRRTK